MGVKDLWQLVAPIGRRISIETLSGRTLAIDASIWIVQFVKAMREEDGSLTRNAHIIGSLRRILRLLYHRINPVFVFDGNTPELKRRVVSQRRNRILKSEEAKHATAQRLLLSRLKQRLLKRKIESASDRLEDNTARELEIEEDDGNLSDELRDYASDEELDLDNITSYSLSNRKQILLEAQRRDRNRRRAAYLPVAEDPAMYSSTQIQYFLKGSELNQKLRATEIHDVDNSSEDPATEACDTICHDVTSVEGTSFSCAIRNEESVNTNKKAKSYWSNDSFDGSSTGLRVVCCDSSSTLQTEAVENFGNNNVGPNVNIEAKLAEDDDVQWESEPDDVAHASIGDGNCGALYDDMMKSKLESNIPDLKSKALSTEAAKRIVLTANSITDWAGKAVEKALKKHLGDQSAITTHSSLATLDENVDDGRIDYHGNKKLEELLFEEEQLERELRDKSKSYHRSSDVMTSEMRDDIIRLLNVCDIPYIVAPFEAEAQCAVLEQVILF